LDLRGPFEAGEGDERVEREEKGKKGMRWVKTPPK